MMQLHQLVLGHLARKTHDVAREEAFGGSGRGLHDGRIGVGMDGGEGGWRLLRGGCDKCGC